MTYSTMRHSLQRNEYTCRNEQPSRDNNSRQVLLTGITCDLKLLTLHHHRAAIRRPLHCSMESHDRLATRLGVIIVLCHKLLDLARIPLKLATTGQCQVGRKLYCPPRRAVGFVWVRHHEVRFYVEVVEVV